MSRANEELKQAFDLWRHRDLSGEKLAYLFLDGHYEAVRLGTKAKEAILVAHGIREDGSRVLLDVYLGCHAATEAWKLALDDLVARGLWEPLLVVTDGDPGLIAAVKKTWPTAPRQRCIVHRIRNVLARIPKKGHARLRRELNAIFYAADLAEAMGAARRFAGRFGEAYPSACEVLGTDLADCLTFFRFPPPHWRRLRTSNSLERTFREVRRRTRVVGRLPTERSALSLVWAVLDADAPTVTARAQTTKARRADVLPLTPPVAQALREWRQAWAAANWRLPAQGEPVFNCIGRQTVEHFRADCAHGKIEDTPEGRVDFHSLRHGTATFLCQAGVPVRTAQALMRHVDPRTTMRVYAHVQGADRLDAVARLADLTAPKATDTDVRRVQA